MLFKLAIKNIKKSVKDYSIYFFTLVFAVTMFYIFNSMDAQSSMIALNSSKREIANSLVEVLSYVSIFVSIILGFLIVYSNNFLIKRRKKEIGLYEIMGMSKRKVSLILFLETVIVGIFSLLIGLIVGVLLSQFLSILVARLFQADMSEFAFVFSKQAFNKTILYFGIIFIFVILFNVVNLNRYKLIDLINADKKIEQVKIKNKYVTIITFLLSIGALGYAYYLLIVEKALTALDGNVLIMILSGSIGTFLLFFSLSGFLLKVIEKAKKVYFRKLNIFTLKQVNSNINTSVISTTIICLMLLLTIGLLSGSMSLASAFNNNLEENNLTDYSFATVNRINYDMNGNIVPEEKRFDIVSALANKEDFKKFSNETVILNKYYDRNMTVGDLITDEEKAKLSKEYGNTISFDGTPPILSETQFNNFMRFTNQKAIDIKDNEYLLLCNVDFIGKSLKSHYNSKYTLNVIGYELTPGSNEIINSAIENNPSYGNDGVLVVSDFIAERLEVLDIVVLGNYVNNDDVEKIEKDFLNYLDSQNLSIMYNTRILSESSSVGLKSIITFIGLYIGITFAISSASVLAIGQLSQASDNKKRYKVLSQIGADDKMINKALFTQIAITFIFPLVVALIHSYFGLKEVNRLIVTLVDLDLVSNIIYTTIFMIVIYGGYFLLTYWCSKGIIKNRG